MKKIFKLPLSGDVTQWIGPLTAFMTGGQFGLIDINMGSVERARGGRRSDGGRGIIR
jgi:hypothetical protein